VRVNGETPESQFVTIAEHRATTAGILGLLAQVLSLSQSITMVLRRRGILTAELWAEVVNEAERNAQTQQVQAAIAALEGKKPLGDLLKDFEGPVQ
jgi:hypothetical protein